MPVEFRCKDAGATCEAEFTARTEDELYAEVKRHLEEEHDIDNVTQTLGSYVRSLIH